MGDIRVAIAEDHYLVREGVRRALEDIEGIAVIAAVNTADELLEVVERTGPDAVVTDIRMPPGHSTEGIAAAHRIRADHPEVGVVVLSQHLAGTYAIDLFRHGTQGLAYLLKERIGNIDQLANAIHEVTNGGSVIDPEVVDLLVTERTRSMGSPLDDLTDRELGVLRRIAQGMTNAAIANSIHLSESSVEKYVSSVFTKLGLSEHPHTHRRVAAAITFFQQQDDR